MRSTSVQPRPDHYNCPYCFKPLILGNGRTIGHYRKDYLNKAFWYCDNKNHELAYVACHKDTNIPLGFAADSKLRQLKVDAHKAFDALWSGPVAHMSRKQAYEWLAAQLNLPVKECHIGWFDPSKCQLTVDLISDYWFNKERS